MEDLVKWLTKLQKQVDGLIKPEISHSLVAPFLDLPGLVGLWSPSSTDRNSGAMYDLSGQGRTLTYNGNPTFNIYNNRVVYTDLDGTGDYFSRADEAALDISGTETQIATAYQGLTIMGWWWWDTKDTANGDGLVSKTDLVNQRSYELFSGTTPIFRVSSNGTATTDVTSSITHSTGQWYYIAAKFDTSTELAIFVGQSTGITKDSNTTTPPASVFNSTSQLEIGRIAVAATNIDGRFAINSLHYMALPDNLINSTFQQTREIFGV